MLYQIHSPRNQYGGTGKLLGYVSCCNPNFLIEDIYNSIRGSKIVPDNWYRFDQVMFTPSMVIGSSYYAYNVSTTYNSSSKRIPKTLMFLQPVVPQKENKEQKINGIKFDSWVLGSSNDTSYLGSSYIGNYITYSPYTFSISGAGGGNVGGNGTSNR